MNRRDFVRYEPLFAFHPAANPEKPFPVAPEKPCPVALPGKIPLAARSGKFFPGKILVETRSGKLFPGTFPGGMPHHTPEFALPKRCYSGVFHGGFHRDYHHLPVFNPVV